MHNKSHKPEGKIACTELLRVKCQNLVVREGASFDIKHFPCGTKNRLNLPWVYILSVFISDFWLFSCHSYKVQLIEEVSQEVIIIGNSIPLYGWMWIP